MQKLITLTKIALPLFVLLTLALGPGSQAAARDPQIVINDQVIPTDVPPMIVNSRVLVPIRVVSENLGAKVMWRGSTRSVHITHEGREIILQENNPAALVGYQAITLDTPAGLVDGRVMVPLRFIAEVLGAKVEWLAGIRTVDIKTGQPVGLKSAPEGQPVPDGARVLEQTGPKVNNNLSPGNVSAADEDLLARIITAEADCQSYQTQVAVGAVILNRVNSPLFPNTIRGVVYHVDTNGLYQFEPVKNGWIDRPASDSARKAAREALSGADPTNGALFFWESWVKNSYLNTRPVAAVMGAFTFTY